MAIATIKKPDSKVSFPATAVEACLREELIEAIKSEAPLKGIALPTDESALVKTPVPVDSLVVVSLLCAVEEIIGFELPDAVVRTGGYDSVAGAIEHLMPRIETKWQKQNGVNK
jgi:acyl carrier protein